MANVVLNFNAFLEKTKLKDDGSNYTDWVRNLRIILIAAKKDYVLRAPLGDAPILPAQQDVMNAWQSRCDDYSLVQCGMLYSLEPGLKKRFERHGAYEMFEELKMVFQAHARVERYEVSDKFFSCKMEENSSVSEHILKMFGLHNRLTQLAKDEVTMRVGNGSKVDVIAVSMLPLHLPTGLVLNLNNCYLVPSLSMNIVSGSRLIRDGYSFKSENNGCSIYMRDMFYGHASMVNGLFLMNLVRDDTHIHSVNTKRVKVDNNSLTYLWHCRLGHIGVKRMKKLHANGLLESLDYESFDTCEPCLMGKMTKTPFSGTMERATNLLEIIHTDVCGPMSVEARGGYRYVLTLTDDLSRYGYVYLMKQKSETFEKFKEFQSEVENQRDRKIKFLRSDRGGEYLSHEFGTHLRKCGIVSQLTPPGTPQHNGVSERRNRTLLDMVRSMMSLTDLPLSFWGYALETAAFTLNRAPSKSVEMTLYELWFGKKPKLSFLKVWGCDAYVKKLQPDKLEPKAEKCVFIGYPKETIGYTFYHRSEGKIFVAKNGSFLEKEFLSKKVTGRKVELDEFVEPSLELVSSAAPEEVHVVPTPIRGEANDDDHETSVE